MIMGEYFIGLFAKTVGKIKNFDSDYCFLFYEALADYYGAKNISNTNFKTHFLYLFSNKHIVGEIYPFTDTIIGDWYFDFDKTSDVFKCSNFKSKNKKTDSIIYLDYGRLLYTSDATSHIEECHINYDDTKAEFLSFANNGNNSLLLQKVLRFSKPQAYARASFQCLGESCYYLAKSISLGEYFILDNYSTTYLEPIYTNPGNRTDEQTKLKTVESLMTDISSMASTVRSISRTLGKVLDNQTANKRKPIRVVGFGKELRYAYDEIHSMDSEKLLIKSVKAISIIAYLDFSYLSTTKNIETLFASREILILLKEELEKKKLSNGIWKQIIDEIITPNLVKSSILLHKFITCHDKSEIDPELERDILMPDYAIDKYIRERGIFKGIPERTIDYEYTAKELSYFELDRHQEDKYNDLCKYHKIGADYCKSKFSHRSLFEITQKKLNSINLEDIRYIEKCINEDFWTVSLLVKTIRILNYWAKKSSIVKNSDMACDLAKKLLNKLEKLNFEYVNGNQVPGKIEKPFVESFYKASAVQDSQNKWSYEILEGDYTLVDISTTSQYKGESIIFMQSINTTPVAPNFIKSFVEKYRILADNIVLNNNERRWETEKETINEEVKNSQSHSLQLLGILGAFIALVSVGSNSIKDIPTDRFFEFLFVITSCICALLLCIKSIFDKKTGKLILHLLILAFIGSMLFLTVKT